jgi:hypothetical protein
MDQKKIYNTIFRMKLKTYNKKRIFVEKLKSLMMTGMICAGFFLPMGATAKMASMRERQREQKRINISVLISKLEKIDKKKKLSTDGKKLLLIARLASSSIGVKEVWADDEGAKDSPENLVSRYVLVGEMDKKLQETSRWTEKISEADRMTMKKNREQLKESLSYQATVWSWFEFQMNEKDAAKQILTVAF